MFGFKKKIFLFTYGNYFWGFENIMIKAKNKELAIKKFLKPNIQSRPLSKKYNSNGIDYNTIGDVVTNSHYVIKEIEVIK